MALKPKGVPPKLSDERNLYSLVRKSYLVPFLDGVLSAIRVSGRGSVEGELAAVYAFVQWWRDNRDPSFDVGMVKDWALGLDARHAKAFDADIRKLGSRVPNPSYKPLVSTTSDIVELSVRDTVSLIKTIPPRFHETLGTRLIEGEREGLLDLDDRRRIFRQTGNVSGYVLRRLTRDQSNKLAGALNLFRLREAGFQKYQWSTANDERVRPEHAAREGHIYDINTGTGISRDMHPGEAVQCRCVAVAYIPPRTM